MDCMVLKCPVCSDDFSEDRVPRNLQCGHSLCTACAVDCLSGHKLCPECREKQLVMKVTDFPPVNFPLSRLIRSIAAEGIDKSYATAPMFPVDSNCSDRQKGVLECSAHGIPVVFLCATCSMWTCQDCLVVDHPPLPRGACRVVGLTYAMKQIKKQLKNMSSQTLRDIENMKRSFEFEMAMHDFSHKHCPKDVRSHSRLIQHIESQLREVRQRNGSVVGLLKERVIKSTEVLNAAICPEEMTTSCQELLDCIGDIRKYSSSTKNDVELPLLKIMQEHLRWDLKMLLAGEVPVYAVLDDENESRWGLITTREDHRLLYSLRNGRPPEDGIAIPFEYIKKLIPTERTTIFFEVGTAEEEVLGRVYVHLQVNTPLTQQIVLLCSAEKGVSYRDTRFHKYDADLNILEGGDHENNDGNGRSLITEGPAGVDLGHSVHRKARGSLRSTGSTKLSFSLTPRNESFIGSVKEGLQVLQAASKLEPVTQAVIRDCGLFIPVNNVKDEWMDIWNSGQWPSAGTGEVIQCP